MSMPKTGDRINSYILEDVIGTGSFGQVWRAKHHMFDERVAIKIPTDARYVQNLRREGVTVHGLRHPNIVRVLDLDPYHDPPYLVMEYVPGDSLRAFIQAHPEGMPIDACVGVLRGMLDALVVAHGSEVIHQDLKPENVLLTKAAAESAEVTSQCVKVVDFGLGRVGKVTNESMMQSGNHAPGGTLGISGTLAYMSPEQKETGDADARSDLYSCGIVLFEMLTGKRPHGAEFPSGLRRDVPDALDEVFRRCYVRRERRFSSAAEMREALAPTAANQPRPPRAEAGMTCPSCHGAIDKADQFCIRCGFQLVETVPRCASCGAYVHASDRFCIFCGDDLRVKHAV